MLKATEQAMLNEFDQLLASYSYGDRFTSSLSSIQKINRSTPEVLDFKSSCGQHISLRRIKGRLVARLH